MYVLLVILYCWLSVTSRGVQWCNTAYMKMKYIVIILLYIC